MTLYLPIQLLFSSLPTASLHITDHILWAARTASPTPLSSPIVQITPVMNEKPQLSGAQQAGVSLLIPITTGDRSSQGHWVPQSFSNGLNHASCLLHMSSREGERFENLVKGGHEPIWKHLTLLLHFFTHFFRKKKITPGHREPGKGSWEVYLIGIPRRKNHQCLLLNYALKWLKTKGK